MNRIEKVLVANRGEIALRVMRSCRRMGIASVAVFSDADAGADHVRFADEAVRIGPAAAAESYLDIDKIIAAAQRTGADAIHPGYGFLAENAALPEACARAGVIWIGPNAEAIRVLGSKRESKRLVGAAGVPVIPGYNGDDQSTEVLAARAREMGFPVLLKASAGGGGKGMRIVTEGAGLEDAIEGARRESKSAFGDDTLLIEKYIESPRHVEIQILGDQHGNLVHLFERECSIQRRHQKIIEETPSTAVDAALREKMGAAAVEVGRAVGYDNAGTVEFILAPDGQFYFLEVNTRLQVEHPVTECVTGVDLVREQIRVARGERLDFSQAELTMTGAAIECRLYAEDPDHGFLPTSGRIVDWWAPEEPGLRIDSAISGPSEISIYYDPMIAKIICHAPTRAEAVQQLVYNLRRLSVHGIVTNREFLIRVLQHPKFADGAFDTHFIDDHGDDVHGGAVAPEHLRAAAIVAALADHERRRGARGVLPALEPGFRNNPNQPEWVDYVRVGDDAVVGVRYRNLGGGRFECAVGEHVSTVAVGAWDGAWLTLEEDGRRRRWRVVVDGDRRFVQGADGAFTLLEQPRFPDASHQRVAGGCTAPMPGAVVKVLVSEGQQVRAGEALVILEAMKMEHTIKAPEDGEVRQLLVAAGQQVDTDQLLLVVAGAGDAE